MDLRHGLLPWEAVDVKFMRNWQPTLCVLLGLFDLPVQTTPEQSGLPKDFSVVIHTVPVLWGWEQEVLIPLNDSYSIPFGKKYLEKEMQINCQFLITVLHHIFHRIFFVEQLVFNYTDLGCKCLKPNKTSSYESYDHALHIFDSLTRTDSFIHDSDFTGHAVYFWFAKKIQLIRLFYFAKGPLWLFFVASCIFSSDTI